jgi:hypothetical protein
LLLSLFFDVFFVALLGIQDTDDIVQVVLEDLDLRAEFTSWISASCRKSSQKRNRLAFNETLELKMGGASRMTLDSMHKKHK